MGFFSRKPKVRLDEFCREFYDTHFFPPQVAGINLPLSFKTVPEIFSRAPGSRG